MAAGLVLGRVIPGLGSALGAVSIHGTSLPIAIGLLLMMYPVLAKVLASYDAAMRQLIERQFPLFDESVEITVTVGASAGEDLVVERHRTKPKPYLPYRVSRPITCRARHRRATTTSR